MENEFILKFYIGVCVGMLAGLVIGYLIGLSGSFPFRNRGRRDL